MAVCPNEKMSQILPGLSICKGVQYINRSDLFWHSLMIWTSAYAHTHAQVHHPISVTVRQLHIPARIWRERRCCVHHSRMFISSCAQQYRLCNMSVVCLNTWVEHPAPPSGGQHCVFESACAYARAQSTENIYCFWCCGIQVSKPIDDVLNGYACSWAPCCVWLCVVAFDPNTQFRRCTAFVWV